MKNLFLALCLMPLAATAQTTKQKVLYMNVVRSNGNIETRLMGSEDFVGPIYNPETKRLVINGSSRTLTSIKEIRFDIREEEVPDGIISVVEAEQQESEATYDLSGRRVDEQRVQRGIYIRDGRKFIKK